MRTITIHLTEDEMATLDRFTPFLEKIRGVIPEALLSIVHKVEKAVKESRD
jgi:hypothetical protein